VSPQQQDAAEHPDAQAGWVHVLAATRAEGHQLTVDPPGERPGQLQWVAFSSTEQTRVAERRRDDMNDPHSLAVSLLTLGDPGRLTGGYLYHRRMAALAPRFGARVEFVSLPDRPFPLPALGGAASLRAAERGADVVVLDSIAAAFVAPALLGPARRRRRHTAIPLVGMLHQPPGGIDHGRLRRHLQAAMDRRAYRFARRLLVASEALADELRRLGYPPQLLRVVPPGRDVATGESPAVGDLRDGRRAAVLSVGNWVARKGLLDLLDAVAGVPPDAVTLHLVGDLDVEPAYAARVRARLAAPDLAGRVVVHGPQPLEAVNALYRAADVFALVSRREPYGTVYGEAMAAGLPVVGWAAGNLPHLARDGREGVVLPPGDVPALAAALTRLAYDETLRRRLGDAARRRAMRFPTWEESARQLFQELRAVAHRE
jgi:glycosyltransferase involved in cell wall biosynthesis